MPKQPTRPSYSFVETRRFKGPKAANDAAPRGRPRLSVEVRNAARYMFLEFRESKNGKGLTKEQAAKSFMRKRGKALAQIGVRRSGYRSLLNFLKSVRDDRREQRKEYTLGYRKLRGEAARNALGLKSAFTFIRQKSC